jgi:hypothetical protein
MVSCAVHTLQHNIHVHEQLREPCHAKSLLCLFTFFMYEHWLIMVLHHIMQMCWPTLQQLDAESDLEAVIAVSKSGAKRVFSNVRCV